MLWLPFINTFLYTGKKLSIANLKKNIKKYKIINKSIDVLTFNFGEI